MSNFVQNCLSLLGYAQSMESKVVEEWMTWRRRPDGKVWCVVWHAWVLFTFGLILETLLL
jgi:hypothetical protein